ncbi:hypothetical protein EMIT0158MI4_80024 [Burkholderia ambifaria]
MGVHRVFVAFVLVAPHRVQQVHPREHLARMPREEIQQVEFARREVDARAVDARFPRDRVDRQPGHVERARIDPRIARERVDAPQQRLDPRDEFQHRERFRQIVVGAELEAEDPVHLARARAGNDDRRVARHRAGAPADFQPVDAGQHQVEDQRVPVALLEQAQAFRAVRAVHDFVALVAQVQAQHVGDVGVVFDDQDAFGVVHGGRRRHVGRGLTVGAKVLSGALSGPAGRPAGEGEWRQQRRAVAIVQNFAGGRGHNSFKFESRP